MKITNISYEKCHNLGNYEHEKIRMDAIVDEGEDVQEVMNELRSKVEADLKASERIRLNDHERQWGKFHRMEVGEQWSDPQGVNWTVESKTEESVTLVTGRDESEPGETITLQPIDVKGWHQTWHDDDDPMADEDEDAFAEE